MSRYEHILNEDGTYTVKTIYRDNEKQIKDLTIVELEAELNKPFKLKGKK